MGYDNGNIASYNQIIFECRVQCLVSPDGSKRASRSNRKVDLWDVTSTACLQRCGGIRKL